MNALNEVNKLIANVSYNMHKHSQTDLDEWLTADKVAVSVLVFFGDGMSIGWLLLFLLLD